MLDMTVIRRLEGRVDQDACLRRVDGDSRCEWEAGKVQGWPFAGQVTFSAETFVTSTPLLIV